MRARTPLTGPALVTGASAGIGREIARELARRGHDLVLVARRADLLEQLAAEVGALGVTAHVLPTDLTDRDERAALPGRVEALGVDLALLVNNAGVSTLSAVAEVDPDDELRMVELDVVAVVDLCVRFLPGLVDRGRGAVLNTASTAAYQPIPGMAGYAASKAFVLSYTQAMAAELRGSGVTATALCPGPVDTDFAETAGLSTEKAADLLPSAMWVPVEDVARTGVEAVLRGDLVAVPGLVNRVGSALAPVVPRSLLLPVLAHKHPALRRPPR